MRGRDVGTGIGGGGGETGGLCVVGGKCGPRWRACQCMLCVDAMRMICLAHTHTPILSLAFSVLSFFPFSFFLTVILVSFSLSLALALSLSFCLSRSLYSFSLSLCHFFSTLSLFARACCLPPSLSPARCLARALLRSRARALAISRVTHIKHT